LGFSTGSLGGQIELASHHGVCNCTFGGIVITLVKVQVWKYKSIEDSTPVQLADDVTG